MLENLTNGLVLGIEKVGQLILDWFSAHAINIIAILIGAWLVRRFGAEIIGRVLKKTIRSDLYPTPVDRQKRLRTLNSLVGASTRLAVYVVATILIIGEINPQYTTALFASAGLIGVALGFGAQSLIKDFMSGIFIIMENQYRVGDIITIGEVSGTVESITIRTTTLRDLDGSVHHVPNGTITVTTNKSVGYTGINEDISVAADTDLDRLAHTINHVGEEVAAMPDFSHKITEPPTFNRVVRLDSNAIVINIKGKTNTGAHLKIKSEFLVRLQKAFQKNDIRLANPIIASPITNKSGK